MNPEIVALMKKARRYLRSAEILQADEDYDSAISRLYYAMFYAARAALAVGGHSYRSHQGVLSAFGQHLVKTGEFSPDLHRFLLDGFDKRQIGDYQTSPRMGQSDAQDLMVKADLFLQRIEAWLRQRGQL